MANNAKITDLTNPKSADKLIAMVAHVVLGGTATNPALFIETEDGKIYLNGKAKTDADGNIIGTITASRRTVDSLKTKGQQITAYWMDSYQPDSLKIKQAENALRLTVVNKRAKAVEAMDDTQIFSFA